MTTLLSIWLLQALALCIPGPSTLIISYIAASKKSSAAYFAALGVTTGAAIWISLAILGVNSMFGLFPQFRLIIQIAGASYLLYIAVRLWKTNKFAHSDNRMSLSPVKAYQKGLLVNLTNPKTVLFFGSIFSTALPHDASNTLVISAVLLLIVNSLCWHLMLAAIFSNYRFQHAYSNLSNKINKITSLLFGTLGVFMVVRTIREANSY